MNARTLARALADKLLCQKLATRRRHSPRQPTPATAATQPHPIPRRLRLPLHRRSTGPLPALDGLLHRGTLAPPGGHIAACCTTRRSETCPPPSASGTTTASGGHRHIVRRTSPLRRAPRHTALVAPAMVVAAASTAAVVVVLALRAAWEVRVAGAPAGREVAVAPVCLRVPSSPTPR